MRKLFLILSAVVLAACSSDHGARSAVGVRHAAFFDILDPTHIVTISPYTGEADTLVIEEPMDNIICMSTSHIACLDAIGKSSAISAVSGLRYVSSENLRSREDVYDIGYEADLDYERILALDPDVLVAYSVSAVKPQYLVKLESLGVKVILISDHLEDHPLARAEYLRLFGALTGTMDKADSLFSDIEGRYLELASQSEGVEAKKVLMNLPYQDQWYIPGGDNYMSRLVRDAGGEVLGSVDGSRESGVISLEKAYLLAREADLWLNPGSCSSRAQILAVNPLFESFPHMPVYNNTLRTNPEGGNDFWESGAVRPDLVLEDLVRILRGERGSFNYYLEID